MFSSRNWLFYVVSKLSLYLFLGYIIITIEDNGDGTNDTKVVIIQDSETELPENMFSTDGTLTTQPDFQGSNGNYRQLSQMSYGNFVIFAPVRNFAPWSWYPVNCLNIPITLTFVSYYQRADFMVMPQCLRVLAFFLHLNFVMSPFPFLLCGGGKVASESIGRIQSWSLKNYFIPGNYNYNYLVAKGKTEFMGKTSWIKRTWNRWHDCLCRRPKESTETHGTNKQL